jgi:hypothetical protein
LTLSSKLRIIEVSSETTGRFKMFTHPIDQLCDEMSLLERLKQTKKAYEFELDQSKKFLDNGQECLELVNDIEHLGEAIAQLQAHGQSLIERWAASPDERCQMYAAAAGDCSVLKF